MKRFSVVGLLILGLLLIPLTIVPDNAIASNVAEQALKSDIKAYVNGQKLPCLIIEGRTAIVAEDLRGCGFEVIWKPVERELEINENTGTPITGPAPGIAGNPAAFAETDRIILFSDIKTYLGQKEIPSFNLDGYTAIFLNELAFYGEVKWDEQQRTARFESDRRSENNLPPEDKKEVHLIAEEIDYKERIVSFSGESILYQNQSVGFARSGKAMVSLEWMAKWLGYQVQPEHNSYLVKRGSHSFRVKAGDLQVQVFYDGFPSKSFELYELPTLNSGQLYLYSLDLESLFGLDSQWDNERRQWKIHYSDYLIKELGNYRGGSLCTINARYEMLSSPFNSTPELWVENITLSEDGFGENGYASVSGDGKNYTASVALRPYRSNEIQIMLVKKNRVLFYKRMTLQGDARNHLLEKQKIIGAFTDYSLVKPEQGFTQVNQDQFIVEGQVGLTDEEIVHILLAKIDSVTGQITELPEQSLVLQERYFSGPVALNAGSGIYRIIFRVQTRGLHGITADTHFGEFYLDYQQ